MTWETFFEKFELLAEVPGAVGKLRELVLHLAFAGRLLPMGEPWKLKPLKNIASKIGSGATPDGGRQSYVSKGIPLIRSMNVHFGGFVEQGLVYLTDEQAAELDNVTVQPHDVLLNITGASIGRCTTAPPSMAGARVNQHVVIIRPTSELMPRFLAMFLASPAIQWMINDIQVGATRQALTKAKIERFEIPLPPLAEQKRIAAKVDQLMALCDALEAQHQQRDQRHRALAKAALTRFAQAPTGENLELLFHRSVHPTPAEVRASITTMAVRGKLVPQCPSEGEARQQMDRAMERRRKAIESKGLRRKALDESGELAQRGDLPQSWCVERFANLVDPQNTISYGVLVPGNDVADGVPFVRAQDLCLANHPPKPNKTISPEIEKPYARTRLAGGEILLCVVGSIGKLGIVPDSWAGANIARAVARIKPIPEVLRDYLLLVLQEQSVQSYFLASTRTLAQPTLNVGMIEQTPIPLPPLAEQRRIVAKVNQLKALVDQLEAQLATARATAEKLLQAAVAGCIRGFSPFAKLSAPPSANITPKQIPKTRPLTNTQAQLW